MALYSAKTSFKTTKNIQFVLIFMLLILCALSIWWNTVCSTFHEEITVCQLFFFFSMDFRVLRSYHSLFF